MGIKSLVISLFGAIQVFLDGQVVSGFESSRVRALLVYLLVEHDQPHSRQQLAGLLWPNQPETIALQRLSQSLYNLRQAFGEVGSTSNLSGPADRYLLVTPQGVQFTPHAPYWLDLQIFTELIQSCTSHTHSRLESCPECARRMAEAISLYKGEFLAGFSLHNAASFDEWSSIWRERLHIKAIYALNHLVQFHTSRGEYAQALDYARQQVALDPLDDAGHRRLMRLLALDGAQSAAMLVYNNFQRRLKREMNIAPERESRTLFERLRREAESGITLGNLPGRLSPLIGRRTQLAELTALLMDPTCRLISLLGPGGSGKTRLALEVGHGLRYQFTDGVYLVPLSALSSPEALTASIAETLGFVFHGVLPRKTQLQDYLRSKQLLLILDSFETILEAAKQVVELLQVAPEVRVLATTRARLNVTDEQVFPLGGMEYSATSDPDRAQQSSAVQLFMTGARRSRPDFILDASNVEFVEKICQLVSGMPLGLLLASTWVSDFSVEEIASHISNSLDFLSVEWADLPERQRSLRATFEYSWNLLSRHEQQLVTGQAIFRNAFTPQAAYIVSGARDHELHSLVGKSLLESAPEGRFRMHDLVHQYCMEKLAINPDAGERTIHQKHCDYFLQQAAGWISEFKGPQQSRKLLQADEEIVDVYSAWVWGAEQGEIDRLARAAEGVLLYYNLRYRYLEGEQACQVALNAMVPAGESAQRLSLEGYLQAWQASFYRAMGKMDLASLSAEASWEKLKQAEASGQDTRRAQALLWSEQRNFTSYLSEQLEFLQRSAALYQSVDEPWWKVGVLAITSEICNRLGEGELSSKVQREALELSRMVGEPYQLGTVLKFIAYVQLIFGNMETGAHLMEEAAANYKALDDLGIQGEAELHLGVSLGWMGRYAEAHQLVLSALDKMHQVGNRYYLVYGQIALGIGEMYSGSYEQAVITLNEVLEAARREGFQREEAYSLVHLGCLKLVQGEPGNALMDIENGVSSFRQMGFMGELGMALGALALALHINGKVDQAWLSLSEALHISVKSHSRFTFYTLAPAVTMLFANAGRWEGAVEAYSSFMTSPVVMNSRWFADMVGDRIEQAREHLPEDVRLAAEARGREGDVFDVLGRLAQEIDSWGMAPGVNSLSE